MNKKCLAFGKLIEYIVMISKETHIKIVLEMAGSGVPGKVPKMMNVEKIY